MERNGPCPCGSGKKYKKCCLPAEREAQLAKAEAERLLGFDLDDDEGSEFEDDGPLGADAPEDDEPPGERFERLEREGLAHGLPADAAAMDAAIGIAAIHLLDLVEEDPRARPVEDAVDVLLTATDVLELPIDVELPLIDCRFPFDILLDDGKGTAADDLVETYRRDLPARAIDALGLLLDATDRFALQETHAGETTLEPLGEDAAPLRLSRVEGPDGLALGRLVGFPATARPPSKARRARKAASPSSPRLLTPFPLPGVKPTVAPGLERIYLEAADGLQQQLGFRYTSPRKALLLVHLVSLAGARQEENPRRRRKRRR